MSDKLICDRGITGNATAFFHIPFEGIPENLLINVVTWIVLVLLFALLRSKAWNYGKMTAPGVFESDERTPITKSGKDSQYNVWTSLFFGQHEDDTDGGVEGTNNSTEAENRGPPKRKSLFWLSDYFKITDEDIRRKCGRDAVHYLSFQRYLIVFLAITGFFAITVILTLNVVVGDLKSSVTEPFGTTTISNISGESNYLWFHFFFTVLFVVLAIIFMRHFSKAIKFNDNDYKSASLMITGIPIEHCFPSQITQHFREAYPDLTVHDVQFAHDIRKLNGYTMNRAAAEEALQHSEDHFQRTGERPTMVPVHCARACCACCFACRRACDCSQGICREVDCIDFYGSQMRTYDELIRSATVKAFQMKLGIAFVTFPSVEQAEIVLGDYERSCRTCNRPRSEEVSSHTEELRAHYWQISWAPSADDINWVNLALNPWIWWLKAILLNLILGILLIFLTTPTYVIHLLSEWNRDARIFQTEKNPFMVQYIPSLIFVLITILMPFLVRYSDQLTGHWTKSMEHWAVMFKTFIYLVMVVLILPSLGLTSIEGVVQWLFNSTYWQNTTLLRWECVFMPDNGATFVNYVITSTFLGTALELIRFPELFLYACGIMAARSEAEKSSVRATVLWEFLYGQNYAWVLCLFTIICANGIICPLIMPFGLLYMVAKHCVDRYNIYYVYLPSRISADIHKLAINCMIFSLLLSELNVVFFLVIRSRHTGALTITSAACFVALLSFFLFRMIFRCCHSIGPIKYRKSQGISYQSDADGLTEIDSLPPAAPSSPHPPRTLAAFGSVRGPVHITEPNQFLPAVLRNFDVGQPGGISSSMDPMAQLHTQDSVLDEDHAVVTNSQAYLVS